MNPQYLPPQPAYGAPPSNYRGPPQRVPGPGMMPPQPQMQHQYSPAGGPPLNSQGPPISGPPRPGMTPQAYPPMAQPPNPNQLSTQMSWMSLDPKASPGPPTGAGFPPMNGGVSPGFPGAFHTPNPPPPQGQLPPQPITPGLLPPRGPLLPPTPQQMGMSPQYQNGQSGSLAPPPSSMNGPSPYSTPHSQMPYAPGPPMGNSQPGYLGGPPGQQQQQPAGYEYNGMSQRYPASPGMPPGGGPGPQPVQQQRRLNPDEMPSAIDVMENDKKIYLEKNKPFYTNAKGLVPPLVTTPFVTHDQGNSGPRFIRSSMYSVPVQPDMMKQTAVPFNLVINPFARTGEGEYEPPIANMGELGPVRCKRCKAYMCPFMQFIDGGRRFHCPFCKTTTEVPDEYFQHLDHTGMRMDKYERPELCLGTYEFLATKEYCRNNTFPKPPAYIFVIDVSYNNVKSGLVELLCRNMKHILKSLPVEQAGSTAKVGFITYSNEVHFFNIKASLAQPQMMVVGDVQDMFMPLLDGFLSDASQAEAVIDQLMLQIPAMFANSRETETILGPAIQAGLEALKAAECAGKLLVFHSSLPIADAPGKLKTRDDRKLLGTDKEKSVLAPQSTFYNQLGQDCVGAACSVDLFVSNNAYADLATIGQVARLSGGQVHKYTYFQSDIDGDRLLQDVKRSLSSTMGFDAVMRVRTSTGIGSVDFFGHFFMSNATDVELAVVDSDKAVTVELKHQDKLTDEDGVYIQVAALYTSVGGQRRLRVLNLSLNVCNQMADLYRSCDLDTIMNLLAKQAVARSLDGTPKQIRDSLINRSAQILACYRKNCASPSSPGQLILPECMKLLPLYINCLLNCDALGGSDLTIDDRRFNMYAVATMSVADTLAYLYPRLVPIPYLDPDCDEVPTPIRCTFEKLKPDGVYALDNGIHMFLWIGQAVNPEWIQNIIGSNAVGQLDNAQLIELDNPQSQQLRSIIAKLRSSRHRHMRLTLVLHGDKLSLVFRKFLAEDGHGDVSASYVDFLCHLHKEVRTLLN